MYKLLTFNRKIANRYHNIQHNKLNLKDLKVKTLLLDHLVLTLQKLGLFRQRVRDFFDIVNNIKLLAMFLMHPIIDNYL